MVEILYNLAAEILKSLGSLAAEEVGSIYILDNELHKFSTTVPPSKSYSLMRRSNKGVATRETYLFVPEGEVIGRSDDKKKIVNFLLDSESIVTLPNTITKLHNLQVQKLDRCYELEKLPRDIWRLMSLRRLVCQGYCSLTHILPGLSQLTSLMHLDFDGCSSLEDMPAGVGQLTSLRTLPSFIIGKESCISGQASDTWNELKGLVDLRNSLSTKFLGHVRAIGERTLIGVVKRMKHLRQLSVEFEYTNQDDVGSPAASQKH
ncbi:hypothetical protein T459_07671 [Capsicum annuum]|uniref:Uncharacterized protein n=1 Tax=Capsicum annuum TaxID=4072 RepID=A0A2G2ZUB7_CAPAN|nr:hypothetical protein T459_07671 [Capsicum annuum]